METLFRQNGNNIVASVGCVEEAVARLNGSRFASQLLAAGGTDKLLPVNSNAHSMDNIGRDSIGSELNVLAGGTHLKIKQSRENILATSEY